MKWHIITRVGPSDTYDPSIGADEPRIVVAIGRPGDPWMVRNNAFEVIFERLGRFPSPPAVDLLHLALAVYSADLRIPRSLFRDRWTRDFILHLPVSDPIRYEGYSPLLMEMLSFLTGDNWELRPRQLEAFTLPRPEKPKPPSVKQAIRFVSLFSGGLDSLVGAIDLLAGGKGIALVGHHGAGVTNAVQRRVLDVFGAAYGDGSPEFMFYVQPPKEKREGEPSMRSRSLLFLSLGVAVASALGEEQPLVVAENGLISLNVPLTHARMGSLSTRTTHPHFMAIFRQFLHALGMPTAIETPYRFQTKGEMLAGAKNQEVLGNAARVSMSCSHSEIGRYRGLTPGNHCGYCVPCIIRRASMVAAGLSDAPYDVDVLRDPPPPATDSGLDLRAFQIAIERLSGTKPHELNFRILTSGPLPPAEVGDYAAVYARGMDEVRRFLLPGASG